MALQDIQAFWISIYIFAILLVGMGYAYSTWRTSFLTTIGSPANVTTYLNKLEVARSYLDYTPLVSYVGFLLLSIVSAWFAPSHPVFFVFFMMGLLVLTMVNWVFQNALMEFIAFKVEFTSIYNSYKWTKFFVENSSTLMLVTGSIIAFFQYSKIQRRSSFMNRGW